MKGMETGREKVKKICDILRKDTLEPAQKEAEETLLKAKEEAERILERARQSSQQMHVEAREEIARQQNIFQSSLSQACKQTLAGLKQEIEHKLFNHELSHLITRQMQDPKVLSQLVAAVIEALEKEGVEGNLSVYIPAAVTARSINLLLAQEILQKMKEKSVLIGPMAGGIEVKLHKENVTIDITDEALKEVVSNYIRKDFQDIFFGKSTA